MLLDALLEECEEWLDEEIYGQSYRNPEYVKELEEIEILLKEVEASDPKGHTCGSLRDRIDHEYNLKEIIAMKVCYKKAFSDGIRFLLDVIKNDTDCKGGKVFDEAQKS